MVAELYPRREGVKPICTLMSTIVDDYIKAHESKWTYKTKLEVVGCLHLVVDVMGDVEVKAINKQSVHEFKDKLSKLPANMYKIYLLPWKEPSTITYLHITLALW